MKPTIYDDQSNPVQVRGIFSKLLEFDKVDLPLGGNGTNLIAPALPVASVSRRRFRPASSPSPAT